MSRCFKHTGLFLLAGLICSAAIGQSYTDPGPTLNMLQQIQGRWRGPCLPATGGAGAGYQQIRLSVSFTHFKFTTDDFREPDCKVPRASDQMRYRFVLRDPLATPSGEEVFAVDFLAEEVPPDIEPIYPLNILRYESGTLRLGQSPVEGSGERLQMLSRELIFVR